MDVPFKLKMLLAGIIASAPYIAGAQTTEDGASLFVVGGTTVPLTNDTTLTFNPNPISPLLPTTTGTGIFAQSIGGGGGDGGFAVAGSLSLGAFSGAPLLLNPSAPIDPTLSVGTTINYSFGVTSQPTADSPTLTLNRLHGIFANGSSLGAVNPGDFANSTPGGQGISAPDLSVVPEPGVTALLVLGGLGFMTRFWAKRR